MQPYPFPHQKHSIPKFPDPPQSKSVSAFDQWCQTTAWHGVSDFYLESNKCLKISWVIIVLLAGLLSVQQCANLILDYQRPDKWVTSVTFETPDNDSLKWPNMRVCELEDVFQSHMQPYLQNENDTYKIAFIHRPLEESILFHDRYQAPEPMFENGTSTEQFIAYLQSEYRHILENHSLPEVSYFLFLKFSNA